MAELGSNIRTVSFKWHLEPQALIEYIIKIFTVELRAE